MADNDFSAQFEKISDRAKTATDTLRAAGDKTNDKLAADAAAQENRPPRQPIGSRTRPTVTAKRCRRSGRTSGTSGKPMSPKCGGTSRNTRNGSTPMRRRRMPIWPRPMRLTRSTLRRPPLRRPSPRPSTPCTCEPAQTRSVPDCGRGPQAVAGSTRDAWANLLCANRFRPGIRRLGLASQSCPAPRRWFPRLVETYTAAFDAGRGCQRFAHSRAVAAAPDPDWRCTYGGGLGRFGREVSRAELDGQIG